MSGQHPPQGQHQPQQSPQQAQHPQPHEAEQQRQRDEQQKRYEEERARREHGQGQQGTEPGSRIANPAQPYADTEVPQKRPDAKAFLRPGADTTHPSGYPKVKYHPVHGGVEVKDPGEESNLYPPTDWFDSAELADLCRTQTEAQMVLHANLAAKLKGLKEKDMPVVRNSVAADEAIRNAQPEPL